MALAKGGLQASLRPGAAVDRIRLGVPRGREGMGLELPSRAQHLAAGEALRRARSRRREGRAPAVLTGQLGSPARGFDSLHAHHSVKFRLYGLDLQNRLLIVAFVAIFVAMHASTELATVDCVIETNDFVNRVKGAIDARRRGGHLSAAGPPACFRAPTSTVSEVDGPTGHW